MAIVVATKDQVTNVKPCSSSFMYNELDVSDILSELFVSTQDDAGPWLVHHSKR